MLTKQGTVGLSSTTFEPFGFILFGVFRPPTFLAPHALRFRGKHENQTVVNM